MSHARQFCESTSPFQVNCCFCVFILEFTECAVTLSKKVMLITHYCVSTFMRQAGGTRSVVLGLKNRLGIILSWAQAKLSAALFIKQHNALQRLFINVYNRAWDGKLCVLEMASIITLVFFSDKTLLAFSKKTLANPHNLLSYDKPSLIPLYSHLTQGSQSHACILLMFIRLVFPKSNPSGSMYHNYDLFWNLSAVLDVSL